MKSILRKVKLKVKKFIPGSEKIRPRGKVPYPRLHLGCGPVIIQGWTNVDATAHQGVDLIEDISKLTSLKGGSIDEIYSCHALEHFSHDEVTVILKRWHEVLKPGGRIRISVPDLDKIVSIYYDNWKHFQTKGNSPWTGLIYGGQQDKYDFHKTGFNFVWLSLLMENAGFKDVTEYPNEPHFAGDIVDASIDKKTFNRYISLNVMAVK